MKLIFGNITLGQGPYYLDRDWSGLDSKTDNVTIRIPRTDFTKSIADYLSPKVRVFRGTLVGSDADDFKAKKRALINEIKKEYTFTLVDNRIDENGNEVIYETYEFDGKIIEVNCNKEIRVAMSRFEVQIYSDDPLLYISTATTGICTVRKRGFYFPLIFPFVFAGRDNTITLDNTGAVAVYPTYTISGPLVNLEIINETGSLTNKVFTYSGVLNSSDSLVITPNPTDPIKIRKNDVSVLADTNNNFEALRLDTGNNTLTFFTDESNTTTDQISISFKPAYYGI